jgi:hypothetical protein
MASREGWAGAQALVQVEEARCGIEGAWRGVLGEIHPGKNICISGYNG